MPWVPTRRRCSISISRLASETQRNSARSGALARRFARHRVLTEQHGRLVRRQAGAATLGDLAAADGRGVEQAAAEDLTAALGAGALRVVAARHVNARELRAATENAVAEDGRVRALRRGLERSLLALELLRGAVIGAYPYGFVDVVTKGYGTVLVNSIAITLFGVVIGLVFLGIDRLLTRRAR